MPSKKALAHLSLLGLNLLYTVSYFVVQGVAPDYIGSNGLVLIRALGATVLFWLTGAFLPKEVVEKKDLLRLIYFSLFAVVINQLAFFGGLMYTTATHTAIIMTTTPLLALPLSFLLLKEQIGLRKVGGVLLGFSGAAMLILQGEKSDAASNPLLGDTLIFLNAAVFTYYLVAVKPLMTKYGLFTLLKWIFLAGTVILTPIGLPDLMAASWDFPVEIWWGVVYVVVGITFVTFLLNMFALKQLSPNVVTSYIFTQPVLTAIFAWLLEGQIISSTAVISSVLIFIGVYFVSIKKTSV